MQVDLIMFTPYSETDLSENPCLFLPCGHIFTAESLDGVMAMSEYYELDSMTGAPTALKGTAAAFSQEEMKTCPTCRASLRVLPRYGRIVRRAGLDESTKKFIAWAHRSYLQFAENMQSEQGKLIDTRSDVHLQYPGNIVLAQKRHVDVLSELAGLGGRYRNLAYLRRKLRAFLKQTDAEEQPFSRVYDIVETLRRRRLADGHTIDAFEYDQTLLQTRGALLAMSLAIRCEIVAVVDFIAIYYAQPHNEGRSLTVDFSGDRGRCEMMVEEAESTKNILQQTEGHIFWAQLAGLECQVMESREIVGKSYDEIRALANTHLDSARELCETHPGQTSSVVDEVREVRRLLDESGYQSQMRMVVAAMSKEFSGTGHWYRCANGHPFTIGECGMPMETTRCPQCNAPIGGQSHVPAAGVQSAGDIEREFGNLRVAE
jgi:NifU-like protein involved in Fe-S cluster formation